MHFSTPRKSNLGKVLPTSRNPQNHFYQYVYMSLSIFWQIKYCAASCKQWSPIYGHSMYLTPFFASPFSAKCKPTQKHHKNGFRLGNYFWHLDTRHYHHSPLWQELSNVLLKMNIPLRRLKVEILSFSDIFSYW